MKEFLKTYTAISNKFIDEYYKFYELCENNVYGINAEQVIKYLNFINPRKFFERLKTTYKINHDFIIKRKIQKSQKGVRDVEYFLTFECFEKICMLSRTTKGDSFRDYFITLRKFIDYYKNHFANKINSLVKTKKFVYIILVNKDKNIQKFGRTKNMRTRLYNYAIGKDKHPDIKFIMIVDNPKKVENCVRVFAEKFKFKNKQELYKIDHDLLKQLAFSCADMTRTLHEKITKHENKYDTYVVYDEFEENEFLDINNNVVGYEKIPKKSSRKSSRKTSRKSSRKTPKKSSRKTSKKN